MLTIARMHAEAGNPSLDAWRLVDTLMLAEVAMLCAGIDPTEHPGGVPEPGCHPCAKYARVILRALTESVKNGALSVVVPYVYPESTFDDPWAIADESISDTTNIHPSTTVSRRAMLAWIEKKGLNKRATYTAPIAALVQQVEQPMPMKQLEAPRYMTPALGLLDRHIDRHWVNYDPDEPDTAPDKEQTQAWLRDEAKAVGVSQNTADAIDLVTRHPNAKAGNRAKRVATHRNNDE